MKTRFYVAPYMDLLFNPLGEHLEMFYVERSLRCLSKLMYSVWRNTELLDWIIIIKYVLD